MGEDGMPEYTTICGTSQLEGYHRWLRACISGPQLSPKLFKQLLSHFNYRWNIRSGIKNLGRSDWCAYSHWDIEEAILHTARGRDVDRLLFPGFQPAMSRDKLNALEIDLDEVG